MATHVPSVAGWWPDRQQQQQQQPPPLPSPGSAQPPVKKRRSTGNNADVDMNPAPPPSVLETFAAQERRKLLLASKSQPAYSSGTSMYNASAGTRGGVADDAGVQSHPLQHTLSRTRKFASQRFVILVIDGQDPIYIPKLDLSFRPNVTARPHVSALPDAHASVARPAAMANVPWGRANGFRAAHPSQPPDVRFVHAAWADASHASPASSASSAPSPDMHANRKPGLWACMQKVFTHGHGR